MTDKSPFITDDKLRRVTSYASIGVAATLIAAKIVAYGLTDSVALLSSLVDSGVDLLASLITAYGVHIALRPPDRDHRYGHAKAESLAALAQAGFILVSSALLAKEAISRFISPVPIQHPEIGYAVMGLAIIMTAGLLVLQTYTVRRTRSLAIASDRLHYVGDILINLAVVATFAFQQMLNISWLDPAFALAIAGSMCVGAVKITRLAVCVLMDAEVGEKDRSAIQELICGVDGVCGVHDLRTRRDGERLIVEAHVEMDATLSLVEAHIITEAVEVSLEEKYPQVDVVIHQDPVGVEEKRRDVEIERNHSLNEKKHV
ncbi:MAG TPA: divalent metal cation transporter FieF [Rhodospirillaceae bacterium]|nr:divalent metal cation transporter FieF [Rhodospirillaceae bacterium]